MDDNVLNLLPRTGFVRNAAIDERDRLLTRMELLYDELQALMDACGHCAAGGRHPNEVVIESAREALRASWTGDL